MAGVPAFTFAMFALLIYFGIMRGGDNALSLRTLGTTFDFFFQVPHALVLAPS
jgi:hypothetical protein